MKKLPKFSGLSKADQIAIAQAILKEVSNSDLGALIRDLSEDKIIDFDLAAKQFAEDFDSANKAAERLLHAAETEDLSYFSNIKNINGMTFLAAMALVDDKTRQALKKKFLDFSMMGAKARRMYTDDAKKEWHRLREESYAKHSNRRAAELIVEKLGLPDSAAETVRKALGKQSG